MLDTPEITMFNSIVGRGNQVNGGFLFTRLKDWSERDRTAQEIIQDIQPKLSQIPGVMAFANNPPAFGGFGQPVQFVVRHPDFDLLAQAMDTLVKRARQIPGVINVDSDMRINKPELTVSFDRNRAEDLNVPVRDVATALQALLGGQRVSTFTRDNELYDVIVQLSPEARATPSEMAGIQLRGRNGQLVQLDAIARVNEGAGPRQLSHYDRVRSSTLSASVAPGYTLGEVIDSLRALGNEVLPGREQRPALRRIARARGERWRALLRVHPGARRGLHGARLAVRVAGAPVHRAPGRARLPSPARSSRSS